MLNNDNINAPRPGQDTPPDPARHSRKCVICRHPDREAIDEEFIHWLQPDTIIDEHDLPSRSALYRHAHATGLYTQRRRNMRFALENVIEESSGAKVTGDTIIRAIRAHSRVNDEGRWVEAPKHLIISKRALPARPRAVVAAEPELLLPAAASPAPMVATAPELALNRHTETKEGRSVTPAAAPVAEPVRKFYGFACDHRPAFLFQPPKETETAVTNTKQTTGNISNRDTKTIRNARNSNKINEGGHF